MARAFSLMFLARAQGPIWTKNPGPAPPARAQGWHQAEAGGGGGRKEGGGEGQLSKKRTSTKGVRKNEHRKHKYLRKRTAARQVS